MLDREKTQKFAKKNRGTLLPVKVALLLNDMVAVVLFAFGFILATILITYNPNDNCWFKTSNIAITHNLLGLIGAYFSDFILSIFGFSGWWFVCGLFYLGYRKIIRNKIDTGDWYTIFQVISFVCLIICSSVFEFLNFYFQQTAYMHNGFGGLLGSFVYPFMVKYLGQLGTSIATIIAIVLCFSFTFNVSIGYVAEKVGLVLDYIYIGFMKVLSKKSKIKEEPKINSDTNSSQSLLMPKFFSRKNRDISDDKVPFKINQSKPEHVVDENEDGFDVLFATLNGNGEDRLINTTNTDRLVDGDNEAIEKKSTEYKYRELRQGFTVGKVKSLPSTELLNPPQKQTESITKETLEFVSSSIENKLLEFGVEAKIIDAQSGPVVTRYELLPSRGVRGEKIVGLGKEIARGLALSNVRIVETIPGKNTMGIEVPNFKRQIIYLKDIFMSVNYKNSISKLTLALGKDIAGQVIAVDLAKMPHLLVAGTTGSGKSVAINTMILSFLYQATPDEVKFIMIDPKMVELSFYQDIPHLLAPVITDSNYAINALKWTVGEMERRYRIMAKVGCKNIVAFNQKIDEAKNRGCEITNPISITPDNPEVLEKWSFIVVVVDELADLMMSSGKKVEQYIVRIAQKARAVGIHLILATQRPSVDVITGLIKANVPSRISFQVTSKVDSRTILDQGGAETLLGQGDMLYLSPGSGHPQRIHGAFVNDDEINRVVEFLKASGAPEYFEEILTGEVNELDLSNLDDNADNPEKDNIFDEAIKFIYDTKRCSISSLQTRFGIGYNRAARIMSHLETIGMVRRNERGGFELLKVDA